MSLRNCLFPVGAAARLVIPAITLSLIALPVSGQDSGDDWDVTQARGETRVIEFETDEGTWTSLDVSPNGQWIVFDLLASIYRMPIGGGAAELLTGDAGVSINYHPKFSPDGSLITFVSDRGGQNNLWVMDADGSNPRVVFENQNVRVNSPTWTADGRFIVFERQPIPQPGQQGGRGIWMVHVEGGSGVELTDVGGATWPSTSSDGRYLYMTHSSGNGGAVGYSDAIKGYRQLSRFDFESGAIVAITSGTAGQQVRASSGGAYAGEVSPDGGSIAFARRIPDGTIEWKGHVYGPRTALWLRDLETGAERVIMDPIESDMVETIKTLRPVPGYDWTPDGSGIVINQGGKIRRLDVATGDVGTIEFTAQVRREISEMTRASFRVDDDEFDVRFTRWHAASPDGQRVAFQAVGKIWVMDRNGGTPQRLTPDSFEPMEYAPAWSPDGASVAFTTWEEPAEGHLWSVAAGGGSPQRVSNQPGEFFHPVWAPDGRSIVVSRGSGVTQRFRTLAWNPWYDLVRFPAGGGAPEFIVKEHTGSDGTGAGGARRQVLRATMAQGRIFFPESHASDGAPRVALASVLPDGTDHRVHATFPFADEIAVSPDGRRVAYQEGDNVYLAPLPLIGAGGNPIHITKRGGALPVEQLSTEGGLFPTWIDDDQLSFGSANHFFLHDAAAGTTDTTRIDLTVQRAGSTRSVALTNARIVTLESAGTIERGTLVIDGPRITCVGALGSCDTSSADTTIDLSGATIIPGLVDMHAHHYREHQGIIPKHSFEQAVYLAYGVTTNLDNSMWSQNVFPTGELIEAGRVIGPRTFSTGDPLYRGDGGRQNEIRSYDVADQNVGRLASWGATGIKQYLQPRRAQRQWIADAARKRQLMVTSEGSDLAYNLSMIMDGQTAWEHPLSYVVTYSDVHKFFGRAGTVYSPTWVVGGTGPWNEEYFFQEADLWKDEKQRRFMPWRQFIPQQQRRMLRPKEHYGFPMISQTLADIIAEGGYGAIGSHGQAHGLASHWEVWMAAAALGPLGALEVASKHGAYFLGADQDLGTLTEGKLADLLVLDSNPLDDIRNTMDIRFVMKAGTMWEGETLDEVWPTQTPFGPYYWVDEDAMRSDTVGVRR